MPKINLKGFAKTLEKTKGALSEAKDHFNDAKETLTDATDTFVKKAQDSLPENMKDIDVKESMKEMAKKGSSAIARFTKESRKTDKDVKKALTGEKNLEAALNEKEALKIIYYLMAVDQEITLDELETFQSVGNDMDSGFNNYKDEIIEDCRNAIAESFGPDDYYENIHDRISNIVNGSEGGVIRPKMLLWNLIAVAYSDVEYTDNEKKLIRYITRTLKVNPEILLEMENYAETIRSIEREVEYLKQSDRKYSEVEPIMKELNDRKTVIMLGAHALITE